MDRNSIVGIVLIAIIIIVFGILQRPSKEESALANTRDSLIRVENARIREELDRRRSLDSLNRIQNEINPVDDEVSENLDKVYGSFGRSARGTEEFFTIENDLLKLKISTLGGRIYTAELKEYKTWDSLPLLLFDGDSTIFGLQFPASNRIISTNELYFTPTTDNKNINIGSSPGSFGMRLYAGDNSYIEYMYYLEPGSYKVGFHVNMVEMDRILGRKTNSVFLPNNLVE